MLWIKRGNKIFALKWNWGILQECERSKLQWMQ